MATLEQLLGTSDPDEQTDRVERLLATVRLPAFSLALTLDPRFARSTQIAMTGPTIPAQVLRQMLLDFQSYVVTVEVDSKLAEHEHASASPNGQLAGDAPPPA